MRAPRPGFVDHRRALPRCLVGWPPRRLLPCGLRRSDRRTVLPRRQRRY